MAIIKDYCLSSSLHGIHFVADKRFHWIERQFWSICVLGSWGVSLAFMLSSIAQYQTQKISFSADTSYLHWQTNFPSIVICERYKNLDDINHKLFGRIAARFPKMENFVFFDGTLRYKEICETDGELRHVCLLGNYSEYMRKFRSSCSEVIGSCHYNGEEFSCCDEFLPVKTYHGPCLAFNSLLSGDELPFKIVRDTRNNFGNLTIELFHAGFIVYSLSYDAVPTRHSSAEYSLIDSATSFGIVPNKYYKAFLSVKETLTDMSARLVSVENRGCRFYDENNLQHSEIYSMSACENECLVEAQVKNCKCVQHTLPHNDKINDCDFDGLLCSITSAQIEEDEKSCICTSSCFDVEVGNIGFTTSPLIKQLVQDERSTNKIDFIVYPPSIRFTRNLVKSPLTMLVPVGGTVGLFIGASLLTIVETIYYFAIRPIGNKYIQKSKVVGTQQMVAKSIYR